MISTSLYKKRQTINQGIPAAYFDINMTTKGKGFSMASEMLTGSLLRTIAASKPSGKFLELGTGSGLATSWILDRTDNNSTLISFDNDESLLEIANSFLGHDQRVSRKTEQGQRLSNWKYRSHIYRRCEAIIAGFKRSG